MAEVCFLLCYLYQISVIDLAVMRPVNHFNVCSGSDGLSSTYNDIT